MIKHLLASILAALIVGGVALADENPAPELESCPLGWSTLAQRKAGLPSYPAYCSMASCRPASASAHGHTSKSGQDPLCNPVTGANCGSILYFHYDYVLSGTPSGACPADVVAGPWSTSSS